MFMGPRRIRRIKRRAIRAQRRRMPIRRSLRRARRMKRRIIKARTRGQALGRRLRRIYRRGP